MIESDVELAHDARAELGEGPVWDDERRELIWVDILAGRVWRFDPATGSAHALELGVPVGAVALRETGGLVLAVEDGFALLDDESDSLSLVAPVESERPGNRMNDGKCDSAGRFWAGSMAYSEKRAAGTLYRLAPDRSAAAALTGVTISNGIDWSLDASKMYYVDSGEPRIDTFDFDPPTGGISGRTPLVEIEPAAGVPDGLCVDAAGFIWVALWDGGAVRRYSPGGELAAVVQVPARRVTSCAFGGPSLDTLYITTARCELSEEVLATEPHAGGVFCCAPGVRGRRANRFAG